MQTVRFDESDSNVINIDDVVEDARKIYCAVYDGLRFLLKRNGHYHWTSLRLGDGSPSQSFAKQEGYDTLKEALVNGYDKQKILIFDSQCEVLEYAKKM